MEYTGSFTMILATFYLFKGDYRVEGLRFGVEGAGLRV